MRCKEHPRYAANRKPVKTQKHPDGCPICWAVWNDVQMDKKRYASTVNVELDAGEARLLALALARSTDPVLRRLYQTLARAVREI
jgi:hypothetical protein